VQIAIACLKRKAQFAVAGKVNVIREKIRSWFHRLSVAAAPWTLTEMIHHHVEPDEEQWFARCRADFLRSTPMVLIETFRLAMVLALIDGMHHATMALWAILGWAAVMMLAGISWLYEKRPDADQKRMLYQRMAVLRIRTVWWAVTLCLAIQMASPTALIGLVTLGVVMMAIDGYCALTLPRLAVYAGFSGGVAIAEALFVIKSPIAPMVCVIMFVTQVYMHWSVFSFYYIFATRRIRSRRLGQAGDTVRLLLNQYDEALLHNYRGC